jgi:hypothetical protein
MAMTYFNLYIIDPHKLIVFIKHLFLNNCFIDSLTQ